MIDLNTRFSHEAVKGARVRFGGVDHAIRQACLQAVLQLDETGAGADAAEIIELTTLGPAHKHQHKRFVVRGNFILWFEYQGVPYFSALLQADAMHRPAREAKPTHSAKAGAHPSNAGATEPFTTGVKPFSPKHTVEDTEEGLQILNG